MTTTQLTISCPVYHVPLSAGSTVCPDCGDNLAPLMRLQFAPYIAYNQGLALAEAGDRDGAILKMLEVVEELPDNPSGYIILGKLYAQCSNWDRARYWWEKALARWPEEESARRGLAVISNHEVSQNSVVNESQEHVLPSRRRPTLQSVWGFVLGGIVIGIVLISFNLFPPITQSSSVLIEATPTLIPRWTPVPTPTPGQ